MPIFFVLVQPGRSASSRLNLSPEDHSLSPALQSVCTTQERKVSSKVISLDTRSSKVHSAINRPVDERQARIHRAEATHLGCSSQNFDW